MIARSHSLYRTNQMIAAFIACHIAFVDSIPDSVVIALVIAEYRRKDIDIDS